MTLKTTWKALGLAAAARSLLTAAPIAPASADTTLKFVSWLKDERGVVDWWGAPIEALEAAPPGLTLPWTKAQRGAHSDPMTTLFSRSDPPATVHPAPLHLQ